MKLLVSAKDLKTSCYIYFIDTKKVRHNNQCTQLLNFLATYNIHTIRLRGCAILPIPYKLMISHLVYSIFGWVHIVICIAIYMCPKLSPNFDEVYYISLCNNQSI